MDSCRVSAARDAARFTVGGGRCDLHAREVRPEPAGGNCSRSLARATHVNDEAGESHFRHGPGRDANNASWLEHYVETTRDAFERLVGRPSEGVPIPLQVFVTAEGPELEAVTLTHHFLLEVPREQMAAALDEKYPHAKGGAVVPLFKSD